jgi:Domain of unknown function (DUF6894)
MAQVYFHCSNADELLIDRRGCVVMNLSEARDHAACVMQTLVRAETSDDWREWIIHVADDLGEEIFTVPFTSVLGMMQ